MRPILLSTLFLISVCASNATHAQLAMNTTTGIPAATQPWYNTDDNYYYLPEKGIYYNVKRKVYIYRDNNSWVASHKLPDVYTGFSYAKSHYIVLNKRSPFEYHDQYQSRYPVNYRGPEGHGFTRDRNGWK